MRRAREYNGYCRKGLRFGSNGMKMAAKTDGERFRSGAEQYAAYLESPEGRLRSDLSFANLQDFLPTRTTRSSTALDLGCGTGATAIRLAALGFHVTLLDFSEDMLELAKRAAREAEVTDRIALKCGDASQLMTLFPSRSFDVIVCHNVLEYLDDPASVVSAARDMLRDASAVLSILVRNQAGEVLKAAIQSGDLAAAENNLTAEWGQESLYGGRVRLFTPDLLRSLLKAASLAMIAERGVRVVSDYLPSSISRAAEYNRIFELERKLGSRPEFSAIARYTHYFAHRPDPATENLP